MDEIQKEFTILGTRKNTVVLRLRSPSGTTGGLCLSFLQNTHVLWTRTIISVRSQTEIKTNGYRSTSTTATSWYWMDEGTETKKWSHYSKRCLENPNVRS